MISNKINNKNLSNKEFIRSQSSVYKLLKLCIDKSIPWQEIRQTLNYDTTQEAIYTLDRKMTPTLGEIVFSLDEKHIIELLDGDEFERFFKQLSYADEALELLMEQNYYSFLNSILDKTISNIDVLLNKKIIDEQLIQEIHFNYSILNSLAHAQSYYVKSLPKYFVQSETNEGNKEKAQAFIEFNQKFYNHLNKLNINKINKICDWTIPENKFPNLMSNSKKLIDNIFSNDEEKEALINAYSLEAIYANSDAADIRNIKGLETFNILGQTNMVFILGAIRKEMLKKGNEQFLIDTQQIMEHLAQSSKLILKGQENFFQLDKQRADKIQQLLNIHVPPGDPANDLSLILMKGITKNLKHSSIAGSLPWRMSSTFTLEDMKLIKSLYPTMFEVIDTDAAFTIVKDLPRQKDKFKLYEMNNLISINPDIDEQKLLGKYCVFLSKYFLQAGNYLNQKDSAKNFIDYLDDMTEQINNVLQKIKNPESVVFYFDTGVMENKNTIAINLQEFKFIILSSLGYKLASAESLRTELPKSIADFLLNVELTSVDMKKITPAVEKVFLHNYLNIPGLVNHRDNAELVKTISSFSKEKTGTNFKTVLMDKFLLNLTINANDSESNELKNPSFKI